VRELTEGRAQFGTVAPSGDPRCTGPPRRAAGADLSAEAAPPCIPRDTDFSSPASLGKAKLARLPASNILEIELATALRAEGIDPTKLKTVAVEPARSPPRSPTEPSMPRSAPPGGAWLARESGRAQSFNPGTTASSSTATHCSC